MNKAKKSDRIKWFDSLSKRDFENGAVLDEIRTTLGQLDELHKGVVQRKFEIAELKARIKELNESNIKLRARKALKNLPPQDNDNTADS